MAVVDEGLEPAIFLDWLHAHHYVSPRLLGENRWAAILPLLFTHAIIAGRVWDTSGYEDRWCYASLEKAQEALAAWDGTGDPTGWHRHPRTGRRRTNGDPSKEIVEP